MVLRWSHAVLVDTTPIVPVLPQHAFCGSLVHASIRSPRVTAREMTYITATTLNWLIFQPSCPFCVTRITRSRFTSDRQRVAISSACFVSLDGGKVAIVCRRARPVSHASSV